MIIGPIQKKTSDSSIRVQVEVKSDTLQDTLLWYEFDKNIEEYITTEKHDGFVVGLLLLAMKNREDIHIQGKISGKLYYNMTNYYMDIVQSFAPEFHKIRIVPDGLTGKTGYRRGNGVITGFSAGIDSFSVIHDHLENPVPDEYKITHFLFNNVGSHGEWDAENAEKLFLKRYELIKGYPEDISIPFICVNSNLSEILQMEFRKTHPPRNVSTVLMLQGLVSKYYYASAYKYEDCYIGKQDGLGRADPFSLHLLSTESLECISAGCQNSRTDKTRIVSEYKHSKKWLNVCGSTRGNAKNCSTCWKCNRTLFTLELLGKLNDYREVFDLEKWNWSRKWFIPDTILNPRVDDPLIEEIRVLAREKQYHYSTRDKVLNFIIRILPVKLYKKLRRIP